MASQVQGIIAAMEESVYLISMKVSKPWPKTLQQPNLVN